MSSWTLILFDIDGMTAVVPRKDLQPCPKEVIVKSGKAYFKHGNDNLLVEVLELSDSKPDLNHFEKDWENSERAKALDAEKIKRTTTGLIGGFLNVWPRDEVERLEVENIKDLTDLKGQVDLKRKEQPTVKVPSQKEAVSETEDMIAKKRVQRPIQRPIQRPTQRPVQRPIQRPTQRPIQRPTQRPIQRPVQRPAEKTSERAEKATIKTKRPIQRPVQRPAVKSSERAESQKTTSIKTKKRPIQRPVQRPAVKLSKRAEAQKTTTIKTGSNNRSITVLHQGSGEPSNTNSHPERQPGFTEHLDEDETELLAAKLREHSQGKRSDGSQTDKVLVFNTVNDLKQASSSNKKDFQGQTDYSCVNCVELNNKVDSLLTMLDGLHRKMDDLIVPQTSAIFPNSTPIQISGLPKTPSAIPMEQDEMVMFAQQRGDENGEPMAFDGLSENVEEPVNSQWPISTISQTPSVETLPNMTVPTLNISQTPSAHTMSGVTTSSTTSQPPSAPTMSGMTTSLTTSQPPSAPTVSGVTTSSTTSQPPSAQTMSSVTSLTTSQPPSAQTVSDVTISATVSQPPSAQTMSGVTTSATVSQPPSAQTMSGVTRTATVSQSPSAQTMFGVATSATVSQPPSAQTMFGATTSTTISQPPSDQTMTGVTTTAIVSQPPSAQTMYSVTTSATVGQPPSAQTMLVTTPTFGQPPSVEYVPSRTGAISNISHPLSMVLEPGLTAPTATTMFGSLGQNSTISQLPSNLAAQDLQNSPCNENRNEFTAEPMNSHCRPPLTTVDLQQLYSSCDSPVIANNVWEIIEKKDWSHTGPETKLRIGREFVRKYCSKVKSVGNFGWALVQNLYSPEELEGRNFNGIGNKDALSPRRKRAIEEAVTENYGTDPNNLKHVRTAINTGIRGIRYKERNPVPSEPSSKRRLILSSGQLQTLLPAAASYRIVHSTTGPVVAYK